MPLGDSITDGFTMQPEGGYRLTLWNMLKENGYTDNIDFVGPNGLDSTVWDSNGSDMNHAGYSGYAIADIPNQRSGIYNFSEWLMENYPADVVMLQIGTNDIISSALDGMDERLELLIDTILTYIPEDGLLFVSTVPYMDADVTTYTDAYTAEEMDKAVDDYNIQIREIVSKKQAEGKPIAQADINAVLTKADLLDGVHPNEAGYEKMGKYWYEQLTGYIDGNSEKPEIIYGDVSLDNTVDLQDIILLQKYLTGKVSFSSAVFHQQADLNQDGKVNIYDLVLLKRKVFNHGI
jgi:lysophospholipase L1-like esterase